MKHTAAIILAAGKGTRLNSKSKNKVLKELNGKPMIGYTRDTLNALNVSPVIFVIGFKKDGVIKYLGNEYTYVEQKEQLGTGHAVQMALPALPDEPLDVFIMYGDDSAFYTTSLLQDLYKKHKDTNASVTFMTAKKSDPSGLGRIIRDENGQVTAIREEKNCSKQEKEINEVNTGLYIAKSDFLKRVVPKIQSTPPKNEYYLTDIIAIGLEDDEKVETYLAIDPDVAIGVNTLEQLKEAQQKMAALKKAE